MWSSFCSLQQDIWIFNRRWYDSLATSQFPSLDPCFPRLKERKHTYSVSHVSQREETNPTMIQILAVSQRGDREKKVFVISDVNYVRFFSRSLLTRKSGDKKKQERLFMRCAAVEPAVTVLLFVLATTSWRLLSCILGKLEWPPWWYLESTRGQRNSSSKRIETYPLMNTVCAGVHSDWGSDLRFMHLILRP